MKITDRAVAAIQQIKQIANDTRDGIPQKFVLSRIYKADIDTESGSLVIGQIDADKIPPEVIPIYIDDNFELYDGMPTNVRLFDIDRTLDFYELEFILI